jgi:hypothetical protein
MIMTDTPVLPGADIRYCMTCRSRDMRPLLDLGAQPLAERDDGNRYPLALQECAACGLVQLTYHVLRSEVFPPDHPYASGNTAALREHFAGLARQACALLGNGDLIIDIGSNDGTFLAAVKRAMHRDGRKVRVLGVEPTGQARAAGARGVTTQAGFFTRELAASILDFSGPPKVVTASNVLAHAGDQHDFLAGVALLCGNGATFITENHAWSSVLAGQFDTVYHEHLRYYSPASLGRALALHGLDITRIEPVGTHGGSFRTYATAQSGSLQALAAGARTRLRAIINAASAAGPVWGVGATTRATPLIHYAGLADWLAAVAEVPGSAKIGTCIPGTRIPVLAEARMISEQPPHALLLAWHIAGSVIPKLRDAGYEGKFIVPLPEPRVLGD